MHPHGPLETRQVRSLNVGWLIFWPVSNRTLTGSCDCSKTVWKERWCGTVMTKSSFIIRRDGFLYHALSSLEWVGFHWDFNRFFLKFQLKRLCTEIFLIRTLEMYRICEARCVPLTKLICWSVLERQHVHKIVNLLFTITKQSNPLTVLWRSWLSKTDWWIYCAR